MLRRTTTLATSAALALTVLVGCSSQTEQYCGALKDQQQALKDLAGSAGEGDDYLADSLDVFEGLRDEAPDDVVDEWDTLVFALDGLNDALDEAGVAPSELPAGERPDGVSDAEMKSIENAAEELRAPPVAEAGDGIEQHALDVCKVDLSL